MGQQLTGIQQCAIHLPDDSLKHTLWQEETVSQLVNHEINKIILESDKDYEQIK